MRILITGARGGIAYYTAKKLVRRGHEVILCVHTKSEEESLKDELKNVILPMKVYKLDITNQDDLKLIDQLDYDVIWAHAGIGYGGTLLAMDLDVLRDNYDVNVFGTMEVVKRGYHNFVENKIKGKIFITSSLAGMLPLPYLSCYTSSKAALSMLITTMNIEIKKMDSNITLSLIEPGAYYTGFNDVMIENKEKFLNQDNAFSLKINFINQSQKELFHLIEKDDYGDLVNKIVKEMESDNPKFKIRAPILQVIFVKIYLLLCK